MTDMRKEYRVRVELCDTLVNSEREREREEGEEESSSVPPSITRDTKR